MRLNAAIKKMREVIGESQQAFATRIGVSIRGLANYEKDRVPSLIVLGRLQELARTEPEIPDAVKEAIGREFLQNVTTGIGGATEGTVSFASSGEESAGLIFEILQTTEEFAFAAIFHVVLGGLRQKGPDHDKARAILTDFFEAGQSFITPDGFRTGLQGYVSGRKK